MKKIYRTPAVHVVRLEYHTHLLDYSVKDYNVNTQENVGDDEE